MRKLYRFAMFTAAVAGGLSLGAIRATAAEITAPQDAQAQRTDGEDLYRRGLYPEAIAWWLDRAAKGDAAAARHLGVEYMDGKKNVVERDYEKARKFHLLAAQAGDARSMFDLGTIYEQGFGVPADLIAGGRWYEWAAKYGHAQGQYNFATMLETGDAGRKDEVEAFMYYYLAAAQGMSGLPYDPLTNRFTSNGSSPMELLGRRMTIRDKTEATARAKAFKSLQGPLPA